MLTDSRNRLAANIKAEELSLLRKKRMALVAHKKNHSDETKIETIKAFLALGGNLTLTATATGIPRYTLKEWKASNWWNTVIGELRKAEKLELSANTKTILKKSLAIIEDRLDNGDFIMNQKTGAIIRKPIIAKDAHKIATDMMDRVDKIDKATADEEHVASHDEKLESLAKRFAALALKAAEKQVGLNTGEVVDMEVKHNA